MLMHICSDSRTIAKRHFLSIVCLPNAKKANAFADDFNQVAESGDYGKGVLPIQWFEVVGKHRIHMGPSFQQTHADIEVRMILPFIITTAVPSLHTLTIFRVERHAITETIDTKESYCVRRVPDPVKFPQLRDLVPLEQNLICLNRAGKTINISGYPNLHRFYLCPSASLLSLSPDLCHLRLEMLGRFFSCLPRFKQTTNFHSLIIDTPRYEDDYYYIHDYPWYYEPIEYVERIKHSWKKHAPPMAVEPSSLFQETPSLQPAGMF